MNDEQLNRVRGKIQRKRDRLGTTVGGFFLPRLRRFWAYLKKEPFLVPILEELATNEPGKAAAFKASLTRGHDAKYEPGVREEIQSLATDEDTAAMAYHLLLRIIDENCDFSAINRVVFGD